MANKFQHIHKTLLTIISMMGCFTQIACLRQPNSHPVMSLPDKWNNAPSFLPDSSIKLKPTGTMQTSVELKDIWWQQLGDEILSHLVRRTLAQNYDAAAARQKIIQAQADQIITNAGLFPEINVDTSFQRGRLGYQTNNKLLEIFDANVNASWNLDVFSQNYYQNDAKQAQRKAIEFSHKVVEISLVTTLVHHYIDLREAQTQHQHTAKICELLNILATLTDDLYQSGLISHQEILNARALLNQQLAQKQLYCSRIKTLIYQLENLCNVMPGDYQQLLSVTGALPLLPINDFIHTPASIIAQRPDVRQAEWLLTAKTSLSTAAATLIFPKVNVLALFGLENTSISPNAATWSLGGAITLPLLNFGRIEAQIDRAQSEQNEAFILYQKTVLQALYDVEIALENIHQQGSRQTYLSTVAYDYDQAADHTLERFHKGIAAFQDVIDAYRLKFQAQADHAQCRAQQLMAWVALQKAVGAGI